MNFWKRFVFVLFLLGSLTGYSTYFRGTSFPTIIVLGTGCLFLTMNFLADENRVCIPKFLHKPILALFGALVLTLPLQPLVFYRPIIDIIIITSTVLILPQAIDRIVFFNTVSIIAMITVLVGVPAVFFGPYSAFGEIIGYPWRVSFVLLPVDLYPLQSIYTNPNFLSVFLLGGTLASLYLYDLNPTKHSLFILLINGSGLLLTQSRSAIMAGTFATFGYLLYRLVGNVKFRLVIQGGSLLGLGGLLLLGVGVGPLAELGLSGRREIWQASVDILLKKPFTGYGQVATSPLIESELGISKSPHNSYLRMFLTTGIIGGSAYLWIIISVLFYHVRLPLNREFVASFLLVLSIAIVMYFETFTLGGVGSSSILASISIGYLVKDIVRHDYHQKQSLQ